jgi:hypothetical protein
MAVLPDAPGGPPGRDPPPKIATKEKNEVFDRTSGSAVPGHDEIGSVWPENPTSKAKLTIILLPEGGRKNWRGKIRARWMRRRR